MRLWWLIRPTCASGHGYGYIHTIVCGISISMPGGVAHAIVPRGLAQSVCQSSLFGRSKRAAPDRSISMPLRSRPAAARCPESLTLHAVVSLAPRPQHTHDARPASTAVGEHLHACVAILVVHTVCSDDAIATAAVAQRERVPATVKMACAISKPKGPSICRRIYRGGMYGDVL